jgi:bacillithiol system protein YtxJ
MRSIDSEQQLLELIRSNRSRKLFLFKHSTTCPLSADAFEIFQRFAEKHSEVDCAYIDLWKHRDVSNLLEKESHIKHESPQVILYRNGKAQWSTSHANIDFSALESQLL